MKKKKQTICPRCKKPVPAKTVFCESCGARVAPPPSCSLCGTLLAPGSRFCPSCGTPVPVHPEQRDDRAESVVPDGDGISSSTEHHAVPVPGTPGITGDSGTQGTSADPEGGSQKPAIRKPTGNRIAPPVKRSATTTPAARDEKAGTVFSLVPFRWMAAHKYLVFILIACLCLAGLAWLDMAKVHLPDLSGNGADISSEGSQSTPSPEEPDTGLAGTDAQVIAPVINLTPGPTQVPPDNLLVYFQAERNPTTRIVSVRFEGGKGQAGVREVSVRLTRSDGQVLTGSFKPVQAGSGVDLPGTGKTDRVEVVVHYYTGDSYTVIDRIFEWKQ